MAYSVEATIKEYGPANSHDGGKEQVPRLIKSQ
jgi:hypothetical protein